MTPGSPQPDIESIADALHSSVDHLPAALLERGFEVESSFGPEGPLAVVLVLARGPFKVTFDSESLWTSVKLSMPGFEADLVTARLIWARTPGPDGQERDPGFYPALFHPVLMLLNHAQMDEARDQDYAKALEVIDWFPECEPAAVEWVKAHEEALLTPAPGKNPNKQWVKARETFDREWPEWLASRDRP